MKLLITTLVLINFYLFNAYYTYEINYKIDKTKYTTELELVKYEHPNNVKKLYLNYLNQVCITPDTIWVNYKHKWKQ